ncbi:MAG: methylated-DNA-protein-cysteine methyltransferase-like protein, partial [Gammaproteobacteria bacterium]
MSLEHKSIYTMVSRIPIGHVATYGQIAKLIGYPRHARQVGFALAALENGSSVPWHRVINTKGKISPRGLDGCDDYQRLLLEEE